MGKGRIAFVPPRYGDDVVGGAETVLRQAAERLAGRGWEVEILTTCVRDHYTWANAYPAGTSRDGDLAIRRFPVVHGEDPTAWDALERRIRVGGTLTADEQFAWMNGRFRVPGLFHHLVGHAHTYRAIVFSPYLFWTTVVGATVAPERTVVIPCLHDENYAYQALFQPLLGGSAQVWFMSEPEHQLAHRIGPLTPGHFVTGEGVLIPESYDPDGFRERHGRSHAARASLDAALPRRCHRPLRPSARGDGRLRRSPNGGWNPEIAPRVKDLGFLPQEEVGDAYAAAAAYIQPSLYESFSRTIMESWLAATPVIANSACDVVRWHCERSGGGLLYADDHELAEYLALVADGPVRLRHLGATGRDYVLANYTWDAALDRMEAALEELP